MVLNVVGGERSMPNRIGIFIGTNAHILIILGMVSPVSLEVDELTIDIAFKSFSCSFSDNFKDFPDALS